MSSPTATSGPGDAGGRTAAGASDGRRLRRERNRDLAVDALIDLLREGNLDPSTGDVAERAGLSARSLFRYFDDVQDLHRAAIERRAQVLVPIAERPIDRSAPPAARLAALVDLRLELFEEMGSVGRAARMREPFQEDVARHLRALRDFMRRQLVRVMAPEVEALGPDEREAIVTAADLLCSYEVLDLMQRGQGLSQAACREALVVAVGRLLGIPHP